MCAAPGQLRSVSPPRRRRLRVLQSPGRHGAESSDESAPPSPPAAPLPSPQPARYPGSPPPAWRPAPVPVCYPASPPPPPVSQPSSAASSSTDSSGGSAPHAPDPAAWAELLERSGRRAVAAREARRRCRLLVAGCGSLAAQLRAARRGLAGGLLSPAPPWQHGPDEVAPAVALRLAELERRERAVLEAQFWAARDDCVRTLVSAAARRAAPPPASATADTVGRSEPAASDGHRSSGSGDRGREGWEGEAAEWDEAGGGARELSDTDTSSPAAAPPTQPAATASRRRAMTSASPSPHGRSEWARFRADSRRLDAAARMGGSPQPRVRAVSVSVRRSESAEAADARRQAACPQPSDLSRQPRSRAESCRSTGSRPRRTVGTGPATEPSESSLRRDDEVRFQGWLLHARGGGDSVWLRRYHAVHGGCLWQGKGPHDPRPRPLCSLSDVARVDFDGALRARLSGTAAPAVVRRAAYGFGLTLLPPGSGGGDGRVTTMRFCADGASAMTAWVAALRDGASEHPFLSEPRQRGSPQRSSPRAASPPSSPPPPP